MSEGIPKPQSEKEPELSLETEDQLNEKFGKVEDISKPSEVEDRLGIHEDRVEVPAQLVSDVEKLPTLGGGVPYAPVLNDIRRQSPAVQEILAKKLVESYDAIAISAGSPINTSRGSAEYYRLKGTPFATKLREIRNAQRQAEGFAPLED